MRDAFKPKSNPKSVSPSASGQTSRHGHSGKAQPHSQKQNRLKQFLFPFLLFVGVLIISFGWLFSSELSLTLDNDLFPTTHTAQSELVIVPPPQTDMVTPPDLNFEALANTFNDKAFLDKVASTSSVKADALKEYHLAWQAQPETYSLIFIVKGTEAKTSVSLAETGAKLALDYYHHSLDLPKSKLSPFLSTRLSTTERQLVAIQGKIAALAKTKEKLPQAHFVQLSHQIRHLQQEKELLQTMVKTQTELTTEQQTVWKQYARIQKHGHLVKDDTEGFQLLPALGLASLCLMGVWLLKEERLSPDELLQTAQLKPISFDPFESTPNDPMPESMTAPPETTIPDTEIQPSPTDPEITEFDKAFDHDCHQSHNPASHLPASHLTDNLSNTNPSIKELAEHPLDQSPLFLQSPFIYGPKLLKLFNNPAIQKAFYTLLNQLLEKDMPTVVGVVNSPELATALALSLSTQNRPTSLVDLNLSQPCLHKIFQVENDWGVSQLLSDPIGPTMTLSPPTQDSPLMVVPAGSLDETSHQQALFFEHLDAVLSPLKRSADDNKPLPLILNLPDIDNTELFERCMTQSRCEGLLVVSTSQDEISPLQKSFLSAYEIDQSAIGWLQLVQWEMLLES